MQGIFVVEINHGKRSQENESRENPFLEELEQEIAKLERMSAEITMRHAVVSHIRKDLLETLGLVEKTKKSQAKGKTEKKEPIKYEETTEKIDGSEEESLSEPMLKRLKVLEKVIRDYAEQLGKEKITRHFKQIGELHQKLEKALDFPDDKKESMEYLVGLEATAGEVLDFLCTSKLAGRFNLLKFLRVELSEALANNKKGAEMHI